MAPPSPLTAPFILLIQQHERIIHKVCRIYTASHPEDHQDLFQDIVLQAWKSFPQFNHQSNVSTWLYRVALNTAISGQRKGKARPQSFQDEALLANLPDTTSEGPDQSQVLYQAISHLPVLDRALVLLYLEDKSGSEIAEIMGISVSNVRTRIGRIKDKLKQLAQPMLA